MAETLVEAIAPEFTSLNKKQLLKSIDFLYGSLANETLPSISQFADSKVAEINKSKFLSIVLTNANIRGTNEKGMRVLEEFFIEISKSEAQVSKLATATKDVMLDKITSMADATLIKIVNDFTFLNNYVLDLLYISLVEDGDTTYPKKRIENIRKSATMFSMLVKYYRGNVNNILDEISDLPEVNAALTSEQTNVVSSLFSKVKLLRFLPATSGFVNNPIYHVRMWLVDREMKKYESLKDRRKELELKLLELKYKAEGVNDPNLKKQIEYYEDKLSAVEYEINKIEND